MLEHVGRPVGDLESGVPRGGLPGATGEDPGDDAQTQRGTPVRRSADVPGVDPDYQSHSDEKAKSTIPSTRRPNGAPGKIRAHVEQVFGYPQDSLDGGLVRTIGLAPAEVKIGLVNLTQNFKRYLWVTRPKSGAPSAA